MKQIQQIWILNEVTEGALRNPSAIDGSQGFFPAAGVANAGKYLPQLANTTAKAAGTDGASSDGSTEPHRSLVPEQSLGRWSQSLSPARGSKPGHVHHCEGQVTSKNPWISLKKITKFFRGENQNLPVLQYI